MNLPIQRYEPKSYVKTILMSMKRTMYLTMLKLSSEYTKAVLN